MAAMQPRQPSHAWHSPLGPLWPVHPVAALDHPISHQPRADNACHLSCCNPPLKRVPKGDWFCVECVARQQAEAAAAAAKAK